VSSRGPDPGREATVAVGAGTVTRLLRDWSDGKRDALDELLPRVYPELHRIARGYLRGERVGHTLRPTELVSEAYLRLAREDGQPIEDRTHFLALAARTMRHILVDHARRRARGKRGAGQRAVTLGDELPAADRPDALLALDQALGALAAFDDRKARVIELAYFGGLTQEEIARVLDIHVNTVARDCKVAEAWLHRQLQQA
jgi:RNA polymerase sigma-70 factor, ECF subfamily